MTANESRQDVTAARLAGEYDLVVRHGADAASPVQVWGRDGWGSAPFQFADASCRGGYHVVELVAGWLAGDCGVEPTTAAIVYDDGSARTYTVEFDRDEDGLPTVDAYDDGNVPAPVGVVDAEVYHYGTGEYLGTVGVDWDAYVSDAQHSEGLVRADYVFSADDLDGRSDVEADTTVYLERA